jgi:hypothetical protein
LEIHPYLPRKTHHLLERSTYPARDAASPNSGIYDTIELLKYLNNFVIDAEVQN